METAEFKYSRTGALLDKKFWEFFMPTILMAMTLTMSVVVDSIIVGNMLGADALAAVNLCMPVIMAYTTVAVCLGLGASSLIAVAKGRREADYANTVFTVALAGMLVIGFMVLAGQEAFANAITAGLTSEPTLQPLVQEYMHMLVLGSPLIITVPGLAYCLRVDGQVKLASAVLIVSNLVNLALDLVYMGPLEMGIAGSSLATVSGYVVGVMMLAKYAFSPSRTLKFIPSALTQAGEALGTLKKIVGRGTPAATGSILITIKILCINHMVLAVAGKSGMVAFSVCLSCLSFVSMFISGAAQSMTPIVGVLYGETDYTGVRFVVLRAFKTLMIASLFATALLEAAPELVLQLFGVHNPADIAEGVHAIRIFSLSLAGTSVSFLAMYFFMTVGRTKLSTAISFVQGISVVPIALALSAVAGVSGIWAAFIAAEVVTIIMVAVRCRGLMRKEPDKYQDMLLLDRTQLRANDRLEMTSAGDTESLGKTTAPIEAFLGTAGLDREGADKVRSSVLDAAKAIAGGASLSGNGNVMDIRLDARDGEVVAVLRDAGKEFSLEESHSGIADSLQYSRAIGFNNHILTYRFE